MKSNKSYLSTFFDFFSPGTANTRGAQTTVDPQENTQKNQLLAEYDGQVDNGADTPQQKYLTAQS